MQKVLRLLTGAEAWSERKRVLADQVEALLLQVISLQDDHGYFISWAADTEIFLRNFFLDSPSHHTILPRCYIRRPTAHES